jgi:hypothetical protein
MAKLCGRNERGGVYKVFDSRPIVSLVLDVAVLVLEPGCSGVWGVLAWALALC